MANNYDGHYHWFDLHSTLVNALYFTSFDCYLNETELNIKSQFVCV